MGEFSWLIYGQQHRLSTWHLMQCRHCSPNHIAFLYLFLFWEKRENVNLVVSMQFGIMKPPWGGEKTLAETWMPTCFLSSSFVGLISTRLNEIGHKFCEVLQVKAKRLPSAQLSSTAMACEGYEGEAALCTDVRHNFNTIRLKTTTLYYFEGPQIIVAMFRSWLCIYKYVIVHVGTKLDVRGEVNL